MILVNYTKGEYVDDSRIAIKVGLPSLYFVLGKTRWGNNSTGVVGEGFEDDVTRIKASFKDVTLEAVQVYNSYTMAQLK